MLSDNSAAVLREMSARITEALKVVGPKIVASAKDIVPVVSGDLQSSIESEVEDKTLTVGSDKDYAAKVEVNTPYLRPAVMNNMKEIRDAFRE